MADRDHLSIGEVLAQLLDEFPDVTISKIRFLESEGLIEPERSASGYRRFTEGEVERLRFILREQREKYLPLRVIKDRLDTDNTDLSAEYPAPTGIVETSGHPAARSAVSRGTSAEKRTPTRDFEPLQDIPPSVAEHEDRRLAKEHSSQTESIPRDDLLRLLAMKPDLLRDLEHAGIVAGHMVGDTTFFDAHSVEAAKIAGRFMELGIEVRHLRTWKTAADREMSLYEQRILPLLRQRNPGARDEALGMLEEFVALGDQLREVMIARETSRVTEQR